MGLFTRLLNRGHEQHTSRPAAEGPPEPVADQAAPPATRSTADQATAAEPPTAAPPPEAEIPLRSLERFRQDPAYRNFMAKARRPPGAPDRRPR